MRPDESASKAPKRLHIAVFLAPAVLIYTAVMILPLVETLRLALFSPLKNADVFVGLRNFSALFFDDRWSHQFWNALLDNIIFFAIQMLQNPIGIMLAALLAIPRLRGAAVYRTAIFLPTLLSFVIVGFGWKLILSPLWGVAPALLGAVGLKFLFAPYLGREGSALVTLGFISVWQYVGVPMMLCYAALIAIPDELTDAADVDGIVGIEQFWKVKLPLIWPTVGMISILTFVGNFNAFDLVYTTQGALAGPNYSTDILGTFLYRTFFGYQLQLGDPNMGAAVAAIMFLIILAGVCLYLFLVQRRINRYQF